MQVPEYWHEGMRYLQARDVVLASFFERYDVPQLNLKKDAFTTLARAIAGQQISIKAADAVWQRFVEAAGGRAGKVVPKKVLALSEEDLRRCGLSQRKAEYIRQLAQNFYERKINSSFFAQAADHEVKMKLTQLKGIGPWTADMFLIFNLWRPNILPLGDLGLLRAIETHYCNGQKVSRERLNDLRQLWSPYATIAVWYLWRSLDPYPVEY